jgi:Domain of unknown function (DUF4232)
MAPNRADRILGEWSAVAHTATPPPAPVPGIVEPRRSGPGISFVGAAVIALVVVVALAWLGNREGPSGAGGDATPTPQPTVAPSPSPAPTASPSPSPTPTPTPTPTATPAPTERNCTNSQLVARITQWEGAAGHRIAHVDVTNTGAGRCILPTLARPQLVDGNGDVLINGTSSPGSSDITLQPGGKATTLVDADNYCGPAPLPPVSVAFVMSEPDRRLIAAPASQTDTTVPPCLGAGSPASVQMQPWRAS